MVTRKPTMRRERWKPVVGHEGRYEISSTGRVRILARTDRVGRFHPERLAKISLHTSGYPFVSLTKKGKSSPVLVHAMVALAFLGRPPGKMGRGSNDYQVNHKNGIKRDNRVENLEWVRHRENHKHAMRLGLVAHGEGVRAGRLTLRAVQAIRALHENGFSNGEIRLLLNLPYGTVWRITSSKSWRHDR